MKIKTHNDEVSETSSSELCFVGFLMKPFQNAHHSGSKRRISTEDES
jgi:hypothetical protein